MTDQNTNATEFAARIERRLRALRSSDDTRQGNLQAQIANAAGPNFDADVAQASSAVIEAIFQEAEELAAVSGRFFPRDLFRADVDEETRQQVLSRLAPNCVIEPFEGEMRWMLLKAARAVPLSRLSNSGRLRTLLDQTLPPTDRFGTLLRELLRDGAQISLEGRTQEDLLALISAVEATSGIEGISAPYEAKLRSLIERTRFLADYDVLFSKGFFGRTEELIKLRKFVEHGDSTLTRLWSGLILTGLGGAGKLTLLAKFAKDMFEEQVAVVVMLDFDRPGIDARDFHWLELEMSRQVGQQQPATDARLRRGRRDVRQQKSESVIELEQLGSELIGEERSLRRVVSGIRNALLDAGAGDRPFLLVLDTFEEVTQRDLSGRLLEWLYEIADKLSPMPLRVIFSGRLYDADLDELTRFGVRDTLEVGELEPELAEKLLVSLDVPAQAASRLAHSEILPRRPLELRLLAKLVEGDDEAAVQNLEDEIREGGDAARELFAGLVYRRVLLRMDGTPAQALAYPGLVLRYVTRELIQQVLVPALDLPPLDDEEADAALDSLASFSWLATREGNGEVWHRKDLRRSMLKAMIAQEKDKARLIHDSAIKFFDKAGTEREWAEAFYHRLMLMWEPSDGENFELGELKKANELIEENAADLPPAAAALLRFAVSGEVSMSDVKLLPVRYRDSAYERTGQHLVGKREYGKALELYSIRREDRDVMHKSLKPKLRILSVPQREQLAEWETDALFSTASWDKLSTSPKLRAKVAMSSLQDLSDFLFPMAIVNPDRVRFKDVEIFLIECSRVNDSELDKMVSSQGELAMQRLAVCLILFGDNIRLSPNVITAVKRIVKHFPDTTPTLEKRKLFLILMSLDEDSSEAELPELHLFAQKLKLNLDWLADLSAFFDKGKYSKVADLITDVRLTAFESQADKPKTVRQRLGALDALAGYWRQGCSVEIDWASQNPEFMLKLLRGPDPEFRDPCRFALLEAFPDHSSRMALGEIISSIVKLDLEDLNPNTFADALAASPEHALESYIDLVNRCWSLGELLRRASSERPESEKLYRVLKAYERWDTAVSTTILNAFRMINSSWRKLTMTADLSRKATLETMTRLSDGESEGVERPGSEPTTDPQEFDDRNGYDPSFLSGWSIDLPRATPERASDMRKLRRGGSGVVLNYRNFSVIMSSSRRMPMITAVNINGAEARRVPRISTWSFDGRLDEEDQWGDILYFNNALDRGHMVRREDPIWGTLETARQANFDSFHFTNSCPQMAGVNQRIWLGLEDYILKNARVERHEGERIHRPLL